MGRSTRPATMRGKDRPRVIRSLIRRDGLACCYCGEPVDPDAPSGDRRRLSIEHIIPRSEGGPNALTNLRLAHAGCNNDAGGARTRPGATASTRTQRPLDGEPR